MADLNYLKRINDHFGHDCGNKYLINLHELLKKHFPQGEIFRIGGDEFVILLTGAVSHQAEEMLQAAKDHMRKSGQATGLQPWEQVSCAMGLCRYNPQMHKNVLEVFRTADSAMYHDNQKALQYLQSLDAGQPLTVIDRSSPSKGWQGKQHGVGWARKMLYDAIAATHDNDELIVSLDADTEFSASYLETVCSAMNSAPHHSALCLPYYHLLSGDDTPTAPCCAMKSTCVTICSIS
jgi:diguanylate cyclase (GGDEF)-like protein